MEFERSLINAEGENYQLSKAESFHSVFSEHSRIGEEEGSLAESEIDRLRSASTSDVQSLRCQALLSVQVAPPPQVSGQEVLRVARLRRELDSLERERAERELHVQYCREQLVRCREHISNLLAQCSDLETRISQTKTEGEGEGEKAGSTTAVVSLLQARLGKLRTEVAAEEKVEGGIFEGLGQAEMELAGAELACSKVEGAREQLERDEVVLWEAKRKQAMQRLHTQTRLLVNAERNRKAQERLQLSTLQAHEEQTRVAIERGRQAQEEGRAFLKATLDRMRREEAEEGEKHRQHLERRMKALLSLKGNIEASQGTLQAQQMLTRETERRKRQQEQVEQEQILMEGGNPDEVFLRRQRVEQFERGRGEFEYGQRERKVEIVSRLLEEGRAERRREEQRAKPHWHNREQAPHRSTKHLHQPKKWRARPELSGAIQREDPPIIEANEEESTEKGNLLHTGDSSDEEQEFDSTVTDTATSMLPEEDNLAQPEIPGLWERGTKRGGRVGEGEGRKPLSKMEQEMMESAMEKLRKNVVVRQIAAGREFKGRPFISKPEEVAFRDFEVGRVYRRGLQLTNVSYSANYCKLLAVTEGLKDFISIEFHPPGSMSAGLTCRMTVTFEPKLNTDLHGVIQMLSQTGPFSIPLHCLTKKCLVSTDTTEVDFGRVCIGESVRREVVISNTGALPTAFQFTACATRSLPQVCSESGTQPSEGRSVSRGPLADQSHLSIMTTVEATTTPKPEFLGAELQSRSVGDLSSLSQKSLTWSDQKKEEGKREGKRGGEEGRERKEDGKEAPSTPSYKIGGGDTPGDQEQAVSVAESQVVISEPTLHIPAIKVGKASQGEVGPFSSQTVELVFSPETAGNHHGEFQLSFSDPSTQPITIMARGQGLELPIYVEREAVDLQICWLDRLYQDSITLYNRAVTALRVTFQVPVELQPHLELLPKHGLVQGEASFAAQLKFLPRASIFAECQKFFNPDSGYLEAPVQILVADQTWPVNFTVYAQVTVSDIEFSVPSIDFGSCTLHESVVAEIQLSNKSILPQTFGFVNLPEVVEVQPNDGFGTLLPRETLSLVVIFSAKKPREYSFELTCKTGVDRTFKLPCQGVGVLPPLELSENTINFAPTAVNNTRTARVTLRNPKLSRLNSAVIRGATLPQGPKAFEFVVPSGVPLTVSPQVGVVRLGESVDIQLQLSPKLDPLSLEEEAKRLATLAQPPQTPREEPQTLESQEAEPSPRKRSKRQPSRQSNKSSLLSSSKGSLASTSSQARPQEGGEGRQQQVETPKEGSELWWQASLNLLCGFENKCLQFAIPCFVSSEAPSANTDAVAYRLEDTLYLEVTAPIVRPGLVVESEGGRTTIDLSSVGTGDVATKAVTFKNISEDFFHLSSSLLDPHGPFELRNALRGLPPGASHTLLLRFSPHSGGEYYEPLRLFYGSSSALELRLAGRGVEPEVSLSGLEGDVVDMGHTMAGDTVTRTLQLKNNSPLSVRYHVHLEGLQPACRRAWDGPFIASNYSGQPAFNCVPFLGIIESGKSCDIVLSFSPDHQSPFYADTAHVELNDQQAFAIHLKGQAWSSNMYVLGGESTTPREESMGAVVPPPEGQPLPPRPILMMFSCVGESSPVTRQLEIGCIKTPLVKKASGDFVIEPIPTSNPNAKAFSIDTMKLSVEAGGSKTVTLTFHPPKNTTQTLEASTNLTLKGDSVQVYRLLLRGLVCE